MISPDNCDFVQGIVYSLWKHKVVKFDGDEMNLHAPISAMTESEVKLISNVNKQVIGQKNSKPIISLVQDAVIGVNLLTRRDSKFNLIQTMNLIALNNQNKLQLPNIQLPIQQEQQQQQQDKPKKRGRKSKKDKEIIENTNQQSVQQYYSGRDILSTVLPPTTNLRKNVPFTFSKNEDNNIIIENGKIISGTFNKDVYSSMTNSLIHQTYNYRGPTQAANLINNTTRQAYKAIEYKGFSMGIKDIFIPPEETRKVKQAIINKKNKVNKLTEQIVNGTFLNNSTKSPNDYYEITAFNILNDDSEIQRILKDCVDTDNNNMAVMVESGAKGKPENIMQILGQLGQQEIGGKRADFGPTGRSLPYFKVGDRGPEAGGYVGNSFLTGLDPIEYFFHAAAGRVSLCDTAVKSVIGDTPIIIIENNISKYVKIGDWIDQYLEKQKTQIIHYEEQNMEELNIGKNTYIPTTDYQGNVTWGTITSITRHDPGQQLYQIKTLSGRNVTVTESKSLLIWNQKTSQFKELYTNQIRLGDCVPVTKQLIDPPNVIDKLDMSIYLPKTQYIYGSDFNKAVQLMNDQMQYRQKIPAKWWEKNNGDLFTLPYNKKSSLTRTIKRSNIDTIKNNCIYPYHAKRIGLFPEQFELNKENGIFIGLYLSEGEASVKYGYVRISNNDSKVQEFVKNWFNKYSIHSRKENKKNKYGSSTTIIGQSALLAKFLEQFSGNGAHNKYVPDIAFSSSQEFVKGILNGYFSGDGSVGQNYIESSSSSQRLTEGISMLCSRLGIFTKLFITQTKKNNLNTKNIAKSYRLSIRAQWAQIFSEKIDLLLECKNQKLKKIKPTTFHRNYPFYNDVVLDQIVEIKPISTSKYPKVYDLTIPSTFNFGLANGLQVRDTAQTGYMQRKLVKAQEDLKVEFDYQVTDSSGHIIQYHYGDNCFSCDALESHKLKYVTMPIKQLEEEYLIQNNNSFIQLEPHDFDRLQEYYNQIKEDSELVGEYISMDGYILYAVNFNYLISTQKPINKFKQNLSPIYVLDKIQQFMDEFMDGRMAQENKLFGIILRYYLNPKYIIQIYDQESFDNLLKIIMIQFYKSLATPKENVGVIGAQSLGETSSQLVLNSFHLSGASSASQITRGLPRIQEILLAQKNIKSPYCHIYLKGDDIKSPEKYKQLENQIKIRYLSDIILQTQILYQPNFSNPFYNQYKIPIIGDEPTQNYILAIEFDRVRMGLYDIKMVDVKQTLISNYNDYIYIFSNDDNDDQLLLFIKNNKKENNNDDDLVILKTYEETITKKIVIKGVLNINKAAVSLVPKHEAAKYDKNNRKIINNDIDIYRLETSGSNLLGILQNQNIDQNSLHSNNIHEVASIYGIEFAKNLYAQELHDSFGRSAILKIHVDLLADWATHKGYFLAVNRYGINSQVESGVLHKASFEETFKNLVQGAIHSETDKFLGTTAPIIFGLPPSQYGTTSCDIFHDVTKLCPQN